MTNDPQLLFDAESHRYSIDGRVLPSVTQVIGAIIPRNYSCASWYMDRGSAIHKAIHLMIQGKLDWSSVDERILGRIRAFELFIKDSGCVVKESELPLASSRYSFAGTLDLILEDKRREWEFLADIKSSLECQISIQLGAYQMLLEEHERETKTALGLELREDGSYRCLWFTQSEMRRAKQMFLNCLSVYGWMKQNGVMRE